MNRLYKVVIVACAISVAGAAIPAVAGPVEERKELMKTVVKSLKLSVKMAKGEMPYDAAAAAAAMQTIYDVPDKFVKLFPEGSDMHEKTEAAPKIWEDMKGFLARAEDMKVSSAKTKTAAGQGLDAFKTALFTDLVKTCKGCHETYRIKKEK